MIVADQEGFEGAEAAVLLGLVPVLGGVAAAGMGLLSKIVGGGKKGPSAAELQVQAMQQEKRAAAGRRPIYYAVGGGFVLLLLLGGLGFALAKKRKR